MFVVFKKTMKIHRKKRLWKTVRGSLPGNGWNMNCTVGGSYAKALLSYQCDKKKKTDWKKIVFFSTPSHRKRSSPSGTNLLRPVAGRSLPAVAAAGRRRVICRSSPREWVMRGVAAAGESRRPNHGRRRPGHPDSSVRSRTKNATAEAPAEEISRPTDRPRRWRAAKYNGLRRRVSDDRGWLCRGG